VSNPAQQRLFPLRVDESKLGSNQRAVLARLERYGRIRVREAGRIVYLNRGHHDPGRVPADWLESAGLRVLISLRRKGLARSRRDGCWTTRTRLVERT